MYTWLANLIGYVSTGTSQNTNILNACTILVILLFVVSVDLIYTLISNLVKKRR